METKKTYPYSTRYTALALAKMAILVTSSVYLLTPLSYYLNVAIRFGLVDFLLPYEAFGCVFLSGILFIWALKTVWDLIK